MVFPGRESEALQVQERWMLGVIRGSREGRSREALRACGTGVEKEALFRAGDRTGEA